MKRKHFGDKILLKVIGILGMVTLNQLVNLLVNWIDDGPVMEDQNRLRCMMHQLTQSN